MYECLQLDPSTVNASSLEEALAIIGERLSVWEGGYLSNVSRCSEPDTFMLEITKSDTVEDGTETYSYLFLTVREKLKD